ncbi:unnamed protein product [Closterium sp. NIES-65]|nr:unnamed protein product [Closterium sp. NIES-65]
MESGTTQEGQFLAACQWPSIPLSSPLMPSQLSHPISSRVMHSIRLSFPLILFHPLPSTLHALFQSQSLSSTSILSHPLYFPLFPSRSLSSSLICSCPLSTPHSSLIPPLPLPCFFIHSPGLYSSHSSRPLSSSPIQGSALIPLSTYILFHPLSTVLIPFPPFPYPHMPSIPLSFPLIPSRPLSPPLQALSSQSLSSSLVHSPAL